MGAPTIYRWDDTGAPVLDGMAGSGWNMLKKCLVEGYGTKAAAGWSMLFEDVEQYVGVIQGNTITGTGAIFQVIDDGVHVDTYTGRAFKITGYETMTDELTGSGVWPVALGSGMRKSTLATTSSRPWVIIADDRAVYIFMAYTKTDGLILAADKVINPYFFGDAVPYAAADTHFALILCGTDSGDSWFGITKGFATATLLYHYMWRDTDLGNHGGICNMVAGGGTYGQRIGGGLGTLPFPWYGQTITSKPFINNGVGYTIRGELPGLVEPCHEMVFDNFEVVDVNGEDHMAFNFECYSNDYGQMLINITAGFRP